MAHRENAAAQTGGYRCDGHPKRTDGWQKMLHSTSTVARSVLEALDGVRRQRRADSEAKKGAERD